MERPSRRQINPIVRFRIHVLRRIEVKAKRGLKAAFLKSFRCSGDSFLVGFQQLYPTNLSPLFHSESHTESREFLSRACSSLCMSQRVLTPIGYYLVAFFGLTKLQMRCCFYRCWNCYRKSCGYVLWLIAMESNSNSFMLWNYRWRDERWISGGFHLRSRFTRRESIRYSRWMLILSLPRVISISLLLSRLCSLASQILILLPPASCLPLLCCLCCLFLQIVAAAEALVEWLDLMRWRSLLFADFISTLLVIAVFMQGSIVVVESTASFRSAMMKIEFIVENALNENLMAFGAQALHQFGLSAMSFSFFNS